MGLVLLVAGPTAARADDGGFGIDLSGGSSSSDQTKPPPDETQNPDTTGDQTKPTGQGIDLSAPPPDEGKAKSAKKAKVPKGPGDRVFTVGDRVKSVQKKLMLKKGRVEVAPAFSMSLNDAFYQKVGVGVAATYWPADNLGVFADVYYLVTAETPNVVLAKQALSSTLLVSRLKLLVAGGFQWSPIYGKIAWFDHDIIDYDFFLSAGFGMAETSTGNHVATTFGLGQRYLVNRFLGVFFKVEDRLYPESYALRAGPVTTIANVLTLSVGVSIFFPMDFEYSIP